MNFFKTLAINSLKLTTIALTIYIVGIVTLLLTIPKQAVKNGIPSYGKISSGQKDPNIKLLLGNVSGCSGVVIDANYALTAAHCVTDLSFPSLGASLRIVDANSVDTKLVAEAVAYNTMLDLALVQGDFSQFKSAPLEWVDFGPTNSKTNYVTCGYPFLQKELSCNRFVPTHNENFRLAGRGYVLSGMSGGAVYDLTTGKVIGVNSAVIRGYVLIAPTLGVLAGFGIQPR